MMTGNQRVLMETTISGGIRALSVLDLVRRYVMAGVAIVAGVSAILVNPCTVVWREEAGRQPRSRRDVSQRADLRSEVCSVS